MTHHFGISQGADLLKKLSSILHSPPSGVVRWNPTFGTDWSGDPAVYFWVVLTDDASKEENLKKSIDEFTNAISEQVDLANDWGVIPYFHFRSESEQAALKDEDYE